MESKEMSIEELRQGWNQMLVGIFDRTCQELGEVRPDLPEDELVKQMPAFLETMTRRKAGQDKGKHQFVIISAPSGGGKGTVGAALEERGFFRLPRVTTREPRQGEVDGVAYKFVDRTTFEQWMRENRFIGKPAETHGEYRGTLASMFQEKIDAGEKFYIEGSAGAYQEFLDHPVVKQTKPLSIFLLPPSFEVLEERLRGREDTIDEVEIRERLVAAVDHLRKTKDYHYDAYYVNDDFNRVADAIAADY